jgi:hypothetical protein
MEMTDSEINEAVAVKLGPSGKIQADYPLPYCTSIAAAWEVVESVCRKDKWFELYRLKEEWVCVFENTSFRGSPDSYEASAHTAPMAICLAFLKLP